jgi:hypothetical protein
MSTNTSTRRRILTRGLLATAAVTGVVTFAGVGAASAEMIRTVPLDPGQSYCVSQNAGYQVRGDGWATGGGARFKLLEYSTVLEATPGRVTNWAAERRTSYGNFPGAGYYSVCAYNTGTARTTVTLQIRTDSEFS